MDHEPGTWLGLPALVGDEGRIIDARVVEEARVLLIPRETVLAVAADPVGAGLDHPQPLGIETFRRDVLQDEPADVPASRDARDRDRPGLQ